MERMGSPEHWRRRTGEERRGPADEPGQLDRADRSCGLPCLSNSTRSVISELDYGLLKEDYRINPSDSENKLSALEPTGYRLGNKKMEKEMIARG